MYHPRLHLWTLAVLALPLLGPSAVSGQDKVAGLRLADDGPAIVAQADRLRLTALATRWGKLA